MRRYESIIVIDPDVSEDDRDGILQKLKDIIEDYKGRLLVCDEWGLTKLAYEVNRKTVAYYVRFDYCGMGDLVSELERILRLDDRIMKYLTIVLKKNVDPDQLEQELSSEKSSELEEESSDIEEDMEYDMDAETGEDEVSESEEQPEEEQEDLVSENKEEEEK